MEAGRAFLRDKRDHASTATALPWARDECGTGPLLGRVGEDVERGGSARRDLNIAIPRRWSPLLMAAGQDAACPPQRLLELGEPARYLNLEQHLIDLALQPRQHSGPVVATRLRPGPLRPGLRFSVTRGTGLPSPFTGGRPPALFGPVRRRGAGAVGCPADLALSGTLAPGRGWPVRPIRERIWFTRLALIVPA